MRSGSTPPPPLSPAWIVPAAYFYILGASLSSHILLDQRYQAAFVDDRESIGECSRRQWHSPCLCAARPSGASPRGTWSWRDGSESSHSNPCSAAREGHFCCCNTPDRCNSDSPSSQGNAGIRMACLLGCRHQPVLDSADCQVVFLVPHLATPRP